MPKSNTIPFVGPTCYPELFSSEENPRIFLIGFNRTGTRSLHWFFRANGLSAVHWDNDNLVKTMDSNLRANKKLLEGGHVINAKVNSNCSYEQAIVFSDFTYHDWGKDPKDYYIALHKQYFGSKFMLNVRGVEGWIASRLKHGIGPKLAKYYECDEADLPVIFRALYYDHLKTCIRYFGDSKDFIVYDIENDPIESVCEFLRPCYPSIDSGLFKIIP